MQQRIPDEIQTKLNEQETVLWMAKPSKAAYDMRVYACFGVAIAFLLCNFFLNWKKADDISFWGGVLVINVLFAGSFLWAGFNGVKIYPKVWYVYTNQRIMAVNDVFWQWKNTFNSYYFKDIHSVTAEGDKLKIDMSDFQSQSIKNYKYLIGLEKTKETAADIEKLLQPFRLPPKA